MADGTRLQFWDGEPQTAVGGHSGGRIQVTGAFGVFPKGTGHKGMPRRAALLLSDMAFLYERPELPQLIACSKKYGDSNDPAGYRETAVRRCMLGETRRAIPAGGQRLLERWVPQGAKGSR